MKRPRVFFGILFLWVVVQGLSFDVICHLPKGVNYLFSAFACGCNGRIMRDGPVGTDQNQKSESEKDLLPSRHGIYFVFLVHT